MRALSFFFFLFVFNFAYGADPFDKNRRTDIHPERTSSVGETLNQTCHTGDSVIAEDNNFKQLKLVGVLLEKDRPRALFQTAEKQIVTTKERDFIAQERLQIEQIAKTAVQLNRWKLDCDNPERLTLKF